MDMDRCQHYENGKCRNKKRQKYIQSLNAGMVAWLRPFTCNLKDGKEK